MTTRQTTAAIVAISQLQYYLDINAPNTHLERTRHERPSLLSCVGEPLKRSVRCFLFETQCAA
jgi:hypothetical protein